MQANKEQLKEKMTWLDVYILRSARVEVLFLKGGFTPSFVQPKKRDFRKRGKFNAVQICKKKFTPPLGLG